MSFVLGIIMVLIPDIVLMHSRAIAIIEMVGGDLVFGGELFLPFVRILNPVLYILFSISGSKIASAATYKSFLVWSFEFNVFCVRISDFLT